MLIFIEPVTGHLALQLARGKRAVAVHGCPGLLLPLQHVLMQNLPTAMLAPPGSAQMAPKLLLGRTPEPEHLHRVLTRRAPGNYGARACRRACRRVMMQ